MIAQLRYLSPTEQAASGRVLTFYAQALSVAPFVAARAGDDAIGRLADAFARRQPSAQALAELPGMPRETRALEDAWQAWVRRAGGHE